MCARVQLFVCNDVKCKRLEHMYMTDMENPQVGSFLIFVFQFILIFRFKHFDLSSRHILFNCDLILKSDI